jgi:hypothetical protein
MTFETIATVVVCAGFGFGIIWNVMSKEGKDARVESVVPPAPPPTKPVSQVINLAKPEPLAMKAPNDTGRVKVCDFTQAHVDAAWQGYKHVLISIGSLGQFTSYLNLTWAEARSRFSLEYFDLDNPENRDEFAARAVGFNDSFEAFDVDPCGT